MRAVFTRLDEGDSGPKLISKLRALQKELQGLFSQIRLDDAITIGGGARITKHLSATKTWNPGNLVSGSQETTTVTVTGAVLANGDEVTCSFNKSLQGMRLTGYVSADDTVTVVLRNDTGGDLNLAEGTLRASVWQH